MACLGLATISRLVYTKVWCTCGPQIFWTTKFFFFSFTGYSAMAKEFSLPNYLPIAEGKRDRFMQKK